MANRTSNTIDWRDEGCWVGDWFVEPQLNRLSRNNEQVRIEPKVMDVLVCLVERPGRTVTKAQFMERVWGDTVVTDDVLARCISELRKVLGDNARQPTYIETIRKTGYRLIAPVRMVANDPPREESGSRLDPSPEHQLTAVEWQMLPSDQERWMPLDRRLGRWLRTQPWRKRILAAILIALIVGAGIGVQWEGPIVEAPAPPKTVPFTSFPGEEFDPALSPDGERLAFVWDGSDGANHDIYLKQNGTETPLRLTDHPAQEHSPTWSPDGQRVAFVRTGDDGHSIHITPVIGGSPREVARFGPRQVEGLVWSPDGATIAFALQETPYGPFHIQLLALETQQQRSLTAPPAHLHGDLAPRFSPDGQHVAFLRSVVDRVQDIYVVPAQGGTPRRVTHDRADVSGLDWTTDGRGLVFASNRDGAFSLWRVSASGSASPRWIPLSGLGSDLHQPSIAQTGQMALTQRSLNTNIWQLRRTQGYNRFSAQRLIASTQWDSDPAIAPDNEHIAFTSKRSGHFEVWTCRRDGSQPLQLTAFNGPFLSTPRWAPDGERIAFVARADQQPDIYVVERGGGPARRLTHHPAEDVAPSWSHDGQSIYFGSNRGGTWQIWKMPADSGAAHPVTTDGGFAAFEAPDGQYLYYVKKDQPGIWRKRLDGEGISWLLRALEPFDWGNWAVTPHGIYFVRRDGSQPELAYYSFASGHIFGLAALPEMTHHSSLAVAPGGAWFLYTRTDRSESDILLVEGERRLE